MTFKEWLDKLNKWAEEHPEAMKKIIFLKPKELKVFEDEDSIALTWQ